MLSSVALSIVTCFACYGKSEVQLDLYKDGVKIGSGSYSETLIKGGGKECIFIIKGTGPGGGALRIRQTKTIDRNAFPISEEETTTVTGGSMPSSKRSTVDYDSSGAAIVKSTENGTRMTIRSFIPLPSMSRADVSDLWFSRVHPQPGTSVNSTVFDIESPGWQKVETTYIGKTWITVEGHSISANEIHDVRDGNMRKVYLDDRGMPVLMINGSYRTEKHFEDGPKERKHGRG